jgi:hypothetical protein
VLQDESKDPSNALTIARCHGTLAATNLAQIAVLEDAQPSIGSTATQCSPHGARPYTAGPEFTRVSISARLFGASLRGPGVVLFEATIIS